MQKITANDPLAQSAAIIDDNIAQLKTFFPEAFTEDKIDFDVLKQLLGGKVDERDEKYGLNWHGKRRARQLALTPSAGTLRPAPEDSVDWDTTQNLMIEGDNLEVLKLLQKSYAGKVKLIYIDPPYNTGGDFVYPDDFENSLQNYFDLTNQTEDGQKISTNTEANGRFHTDWLNMMYPRLKLARNLLTPDGVLCMSIDDSENKNAQQILDEVFGAECFLGCVVRATGTTTGQDSGGLGRSFDYLLCYGRDPDIQLSGIPLDDEDKKRFREEDERGQYSTLQLRKTGNADRREDRPSMYYGVEAPDGIDIYPIGPGGYQSRWRFGPKTYQEYLSTGMIVWKKVVRDDEEVWQPYVKYYLEGRTKRPSPLWDDIDGNKKATIEVRDLLGDKVFNNPKPQALIERIMQMVFGDQSDGIILDFFAGSGTTGHAVLKQNAAEEISRNYILVQLPEPLDPNKREQRVAANFCKSLKKPQNIAELTKERLRRAAKKVREENPNFNNDLGFRVFKLDTTNIRAWDPNRDDLQQTLLDNADHIRADRSENDILYELLLKLGLDLCVPIEQKTIAGKTVYSIGAGVLIVCLAKEISRAEAEPLALGIIEWLKALDPAGETSVVFRDSAFVDDVTKTNLSAILQQYGIETVRSL